MPIKGEHINLSEGIPLQIALPSKEIKLHSSRCHIVAQNTMYQLAVKNQLKLKRREMGQRVISG